MSNLQLKRVGRLKRRNFVETQDLRSDPAWVAVRTTLMHALALDVRIELAATLMRECAGNALATDLAMALDPVVMFSIAKAKGAFGPVEQ